jgi:hypothetical protein
MGMNIFILKGLAWHDNAMFSLTITKF